MRDWDAIAKRIQEEGPLAVSAAARLVRAERGRRGHVSSGTLIRWIIHGKQGVHLDGVRLAGETWYTSAAAINRFAAALSEQAAGKGPGPEEPVGLTARRARARQAMEELRKGRREQSPA